ncbi:MAG TPA: DUF2807 domain-containing protein [Rhizomicrobium sp.]
MKIALRLLLAAPAAVGAAFAASAATIVPAAPFDSIELEGGGHVTLIRGSVQQVRILKGSTAYTRIHADDSDPRKLIIESCNADCPHPYDLDVEIVTPQIRAVAVAGGGAIESSGTFPAQHSIAVAVHGGGRVDVRSIDSADAIASIDGGGTISVKAAEGLTAAINGGGKIRYWGNPHITEAVNGGGSVSRGN